MMIAVDTTLVDYSLKYALEISDSEEINYICNRINEAIPGMMAATTTRCIQLITDYLKTHEPDYLKYSPLSKLQVSLEAHRKENLK